jgi:hypothetical protein
LQVASLAGLRRSPAALAAALSDVITPLTGVVIISDIMVVALNSSANLL